MTPQGEKRTQSATYIEQYMFAHVLKRTCQSTLATATKSFLIIGQLQTRIIFVIANFILRQLNSHMCANIEQYIEQTYIEQYVCDHVPKSTCRSTLATTT